ncbi:hypothetical protein [Poseidonibacter ostreae]|uniref:Site-specific integrase n=1 Tax=Poseidonibacter ostreae TaxID=2654171 RepID=A0A6L4WWK3_9BACT|nr:hypothetical protein [Poseidonibacter ostreae]KAB7888878.1 hypothetical protein GBG18_12240 [Poseidonibacter ostreae]KAB7889631.1 hypothetical protein GBG19_05330 [Poseidonibacter ostreae]
MRGSTYFQTAQLTKIIFRECAKKKDRINPNHQDYQVISSFKSMETYRNVWNNFLNYLKEHWKLKNSELITAEHVEAYLLYKVEYHPSKQYIEKISSAIGKLEIALNRYSKEKYNNPIIYDFRIRETTLNNIRDLKLVANNYHNRVYLDPLIIINNMKDDKHKLAAKIQLQGGARVEAVTLINLHQLRGFQRDRISNNTKGVIETVEKGGKKGDVFVSESTYKELENYFEDNNINQFRIKYAKYTDDIKQSCLELNILSHSTHGFRWTFAQNRVREYQYYNYSYEQALQAVSWEMKHFRASITEHYLQ